MAFNSILSGIARLMTAPAEDRARDATPTSPVFNITNNHNNSVEWAADRLPTIHIHTAPANNNMPPHNSNRGASTYSHTATQTSSQFDLPIRTNTAAVYSQQGTGIQAAHYATTPQYENNTTTKIAPRKARTGPTFEERAEGARRWNRALRPKLANGLE